MEWKKWENKIGIFQEWVNKEKSNTKNRWWLYLAEIFFRESCFIRNSLQDSTKLFLDVGCGSGGFLCRFADSGDYEGVGLDPLSEGSLRILKERIKDNEVAKRIELIRGVGEYLPIKEDCAQLCTMNEALDHVNNPYQTVQEIHRILVDGGYFLLLQSAVTNVRNNDDSTHLRAFTVEDLTKLFDNFRIEEIRRIFLVHFIFIFWKETLLDLIHIIIRLFSARTRSLGFPSVEKHGVANHLKSVLIGVGQYLGYSEVLLIARKTTVTNGTKALSITEEHNAQK